MIKKYTVLFFVFVLGFISVLYIFYPSYSPQLSNIFQQKNLSLQKDAVSDEISLTGQLKIERIPAELELREYWYWLYLDNPYNLEDNSSGKPQSIKKIQIITDIQQDEESGKNGYLDSFVDQKVTATGSFSSGYSESTVLLVKNLTKK